MECPDCGGTGKDDTPTVRVQTALALAQLNDRRAVPALIAALKDKDEEVRAAVVRALRTITRQRFGKNTPEVWEAWWKTKGKAD